MRHWDARFRLNIAFWRGKEFSKRKGEKKNEMLEGRQLPTHRRWAREQARSRAGRRGDPGLRSQEEHRWGEPLHHPSANPALGQGDSQGDITAHLPICSGNELREPLVLSLQSSSAGRVLQPGMEQWLTWLACNPQAVTQAAAYPGWAPPSIAPPATTSWGSSPVAEG